MEKQMALFRTGENDDAPIWHNLPLEKREKIKALFAALLIRYLHAAYEEVTADEKP